MSIAFEAFTIGSPKPNPSSTVRASMALCSSPSAVRFESISRRRTHCSYRVSPVVAPGVSPKGLGFGLQLPLPRPSLRNRLILSFAAHEESKHSDIDVQEEKSDLGARAEESEEAWKETLASFKEQALKMQSISQQAYEEYSKKAMVILKETSEQLKIQADKAREDLTVIAKEISEEGKMYLSTAAENSPEGVKDIVETFSSSTDDLNEISKVRDFYIGIPYGGLLTIGGFLSFMLTGSISAIRFGIVLGGTLLALSISSLRSWKRGESSSLAVNGQAAIASILFVREFRSLFAKPAFTSFLAVLVSGSAVAFYIYRIGFYGEQMKGSNEPGTEN